jgi:hypothetical protein
MSEFKAVASIADFCTLDEAEILLGYLDGFEGLPCTGSNQTRSCFHGWRKGMFDAGFALPDAAQRALDAEFETGAGPTFH